MTTPNLLVTVPHSGEWIPPEASWLHGLPREVLLLDVDRFVDELYEPVVSRFNIPFVKTLAHRYAVDLNRYPDDVDAGTVVGSALPPGTHPRGFHWARSTQDHPLLTSPITAELHQTLVRLYHDPFHAEIQRALHLMPRAVEVFHLDCHSMPSSGTDAHADSGTRRPDVVLSDFEGKSSRPDFLALLHSAFLKEGLSVSINSPYKGGRITQRYGHPERHHHTVQIELNRALYMDERSREPLKPQFSQLQESLTRVIGSACKFSLEHQQQPYTG